MSNFIEGAKIDADVAIIKSYDNLWSHKIFPNNNAFDYNQLLISYYNALMENNINTDVTGIDTDFSRYKIVLMPAYNITTEQIKRKCEDYVVKGGVLLITFRSGIRTWNNRMTEQTLPGDFRELSGVELEEYDSLNHGRKTGVEGIFGDGAASIWCDVIKSNSAQILATYKGCFYEGRPAITLNGFGLGRVLYIGCDLDKQTLNNVIEYISNEAGIVSVLEKKLEGVETVRKVKDGKSYLMVMNHNSKSVKVRIAGNYTEAITGREIKDEIDLEAYDVAVLV